jgi:hypothetical protein
MVMTTDFSAGAQALGYLYQARYALWLLLNREEELELSIEALDDVEFDDKGNPRELLQLKHHNRSISLTDTSSELWKTLRIWSSHFNNGKISPSSTILTLATTSVATANSIAAKLRSDITRNPMEACQALTEIARSSSNESLKDAFTEFLKLSEEDRFYLIRSVYILDQSTDIQDTAELIKERIKFSVDRTHRDGLYERLEGWWFNKVVCHLSSKVAVPISGFEVSDQINNIARQFQPDALPIDFLDAEPERIDAEGDNRLFVRQLKAIAVHNKRIENAIVDYYRAFEQRSRWAREHLLIGEELQQYEKRLVDEWGRLSLAIADDNNFNTLDEPELQQIGRKIYNWAEQEADYKIRTNVTEPYILRGSYHMLADDNPPRVWWHPKFTERMLQVLKEGGVDI